MAPSAISMKLRLRLPPKYRRCEQYPDRGPQDPARNLGLILAQRCTEAEEARVGSVEAKRKACASGTRSSLTQLRTAAAMLSAEPASVPSAVVQRPSRTSISRP